MTRGGNPIRERYSFLSDCQYALQPLDIVDLINHKSWKAESEYPPDKSNYMPVRENVNEEEAAAQANGESRAKAPAPRKSKELTEGEKDKNQRRARNTDKAPLKQEEWEELKRWAYEDLITRRDSSESIVDGAVESVDFTGMKRNVHCEMFLKFDWNLPDPSAHSTILKEVNARLASWDEEAKAKKVPERLLQMTVAKNSSSTSLKGSGDLIANVYADLYSHDPSEWSGMISTTERALEEVVKGFPANYPTKHASMIGKWKKWSSGDREHDITLDKIHVNDRKKYASDKQNGILRRPQDGNRDSIYTAFDKRDKLVIFSRSQSH
ncbi:hypothetical protein OEA41_009720 [Lepraria neglecta]|uniref:Uncharacterized protein n=1 Tax=Lepraria neglecta TaxID=209136 RepID=A0AAD9Z6C2_9LECA|nr:hypothetical protein OEA41_009720 [Lepraria neglecta]